MSGAVVNGGFAEESVVSSGASSPDQEVGLNYVSFLVTLFLQKYLT